MKNQRFEVLAPCLVALIKEDLPLWRSWRTGPFDRSLLAATWDPSSEYTYRILILYDYMIKKRIGYII